MASSKLFKVFVYGTLKRNQPNSHILADSENGFANFLSEGKTSQKYPLVVGKGCYSLSAITSPFFRFKVHDTTFHFF